MQIKDFRHPYMHWSMYDDTPTDRDFDSREDFIEAYDSQELELDAPPGVMDGIYRFNIYGSDKEYTGIIIDKGEFEPHGTANAIYIALCDYYEDDQFDHVFIEKLEWKGTDFKVWLGS